MKTETQRFRRRDEAAHIVTDGRSVRIYRECGCYTAATLFRAIAYLEGQGFRIVTDYFG